MGTHMSAQWELTNEYQYDNLPIQNNPKKQKNDWNPGKWVLIWVLRESFLMNTNMTGFMFFEISFIPVLWTKVAKALEGLLSSIWYTISSEIYTIVRIQWLTHLYLVWPWTDNFEDNL